MQQRQLRLGDILDDYCPRERRLANHTIVAMVGDEIRLTRCTTCDTEHPYKGGKAPRLRKKKAVATLAPPPGDTVEAAKEPQAVLVTHTEDESSPETPLAAEVSANGGAPQDSNGSAPEHAPEEVRLHRPLIRAQLPRIEREPAPRPVPEFTIRQANKRQGRFQNSRPARFAKGGGQMNRQGGGNSRGPEGRQGGRPQGGGNRNPMRQGRHPGQHSGKKRSR